MANCSILIGGNSNRYSITYNKKHEKAVDRDQTCIDCHKGIAHQLPEEPESTDTTEGEQL